MMRAARVYGGGGSKQGWGRAVLGSVVAHGLVLGAIGSGAPVSSPGVALAPALREGLALEAAALVDLVALDVDTTPPAEESFAPPPDQAAPREDARGAFPADQARLGPAAVRPPRSGPLEAPAVPAADRGDGAGRRVEGVAWRRDDSTLHERLTDGAERYQPAHTPTRAHAAPSSPEAVRREPLVGPGDSPRTRSARSAVSALQPLGEPAPVSGSWPLEEAAASGAVVTPTPAIPATPATPATPAGPPSAPAAARTVLLTTEGPLDAERGPSAFDVAPGALARDTVARRAASAEAHPSITDLTLAASGGEDARGRGPSVLPGAVARPSPGVAPSAAGLGGPAGASGDAARMRERVYARYELEIRARVNGVLGRVWPRALALRLEQGETMIAFVVQPDGRLAGPVRVTKSAGFDEFDRAAIEAIRLVTPFPPIPRSPGVDRASALPISLRVTFSNPVIR